jgi:hypothetical protein
MTIPFSVCSNRFSRWCSRSTSLAWSESDLLCRRQRSGETEGSLGDDCQRAIALALVRALRTLTDWPLILIDLYT